VPISFLGPCPASGEESTRTDLCPPAHALHDGDAAHGSLAAVTHVILLAVTGFVGGIFGSMVGLGGGVFIIPGLTLFLGVPIHEAIAASLIAVIATSTTAAAAYLRDDLSNMRLGMTMETLNVSGALAGGFAAGLLSKGVLSVIFGGMMILVSIYMGLRRGAVARLAGMGEELGLLGASYYDKNAGRHVRYRVRHLPLGLGASLIAGLVSGLLGVGGGFLKVPAMVIGMGVPVRAAVSTSSLMIGVTACAGAVVYFSRGLVNPVVTVPVVLGVTAGAFVGSHLGIRVRSSRLTIILAVVLFALSLQMILSVFGIKVR
jgi:uncharacterized membrane protein YfcA